MLIKGDFIRLDENWVKSLPQVLTEAKSMTGIQVRLRLVDDACEALCSWWPRSTCESLRALGSPS